MSKPNTTGGGGMNSQEAQQAQTIDKSVKQLRGWLKENSVNGLSRGPFYDNIESVLNHVDSQAQKIAEARNEAKYWRDRAVGTLHPRDRGKVNPLPWVDGP